MSLVNMINGANRVSFSAMENPGDRLRIARKQLGLSAQVVAKRANSSTSAVRAHENGQNGIRPDVAETYGAILGVEASWILYGSDSRSGAASLLQARGNFLRAWREFRGMSLDELAKKAGTAKQVLADLEENGQPLSGKWLAQLAPALGTRAGFLQDFNPEEADAQLLEMLLSSPKDDQAKAAEVIRLFKARQ